MNVSCPECSTIYRVDPAKVPVGGVRARCSACGGVIPVGMAVAATQADPTVTSGVELSVSLRGRSPFVPPFSHPPFASPAATLPPRESQRETAVSVPSVTPPSLPARPVPPVLPASTPVSPLAPSSPFPSSPDRRPINPFLSRDPGLRAKRLSRALVSDMVAYYPAKHSEGLEKGTLKELFRDEIKKSYDEYVAQVGSELARSTTHFQESLNEVLGAGRKIF
ncbi:MAG: zinc-ribbon domain-containing protein [Gemmatimonadaceae bacterium]|nr:zinc-ribbon domain-containing protein [Gemmatimonadaceae bacterium]